MNALKVYEYLCKSRVKVFDAARSLAPEDYMRQFPFGLNTIGRTLTHTMITEWAYTQRLQGRELPPYDTWPIQDERPPAFGVIENTWNAQAPETRRVLETCMRDERWEREFEYVSKSREGKKAVITVSMSDIATQMVLHEVHHRAQVLAMLREVGASVQDIDFGYFMFKRRVIE